MNPTVFLAALIALIAPAPDRRDIRFPTDAGVVDVTQPPYRARGDGVTDDTAALQRAIDDHTGKRRVIYLPRGIYLVSKSLRWPENDPQGAHVWGFTHIQGQGRDRTVLLLKAGSFRDTAAPQPVMTAGTHGSADWFANYVCDLTIDTGMGNPGAIGLQFFSNNVGAVRSVRIASGDGQGAVGLDLGYNNMNGPLLVKDLQVDGFEIGVQTGGPVNSQTFERLVLNRQRVCGLRNDGQSLSLRQVTITGAGAAIENRGGLLALIDARLTGTGTGDAIVNRGALWVRNLTAHRFSRAIRNDAGHRRGASGPTIAEFASDENVALFDGPAVRPLPIRETPTIPDDDPARWASVVRFGADPTGDRDSAPAIQAAIDSGAQTVYFPTGNYRLDKTVIVRKKTRRILGFNSVVDYTSRVTPALEIADGDAPIVSIENFFPLGSGIVHSSARTLVLKDSELRSYQGTGQGDVFVEDVVAGPWSFDRQRVYARQLNAENKGTHIENKGGKLWILGYKTERGGTLVETTRGGATQIDGGFSYTTEFGTLAPMFVCNESALALTFAEICFNNDPYTTLLSETRGGQTRSLPRTDRRWKGVFVRSVTASPGR
jgi:hypothetical protein